MADVQHENANGGSLTDAAVDQGWLIFRCLSQRSSLPSSSLQQFCFVHAAVLSGVVLRVDSPGGDALASDLMWREIRMLAEKKPVVACMGDVAASGGYYMSMAGQVRHPGDQASGSCVPEYFYSARTLLQCQDAPGCTSLLAVGASLFLLFGTLG
jgi:hypothetical protein